jgi:hypothetical protein
VETPNEPTEHCITKESIEQACATEGRARYLQASTTPMMQSPLLEDFGYLGLTPSADAVLDGTYTPDPSVDEITKKFLVQLQRPPGDIPELQHLFTTDEFIQSWQKMRSTTSSSPFSPLFTDFIAGCSDRKTAALDAAMANIPLLTGYCPKSWRQAIDVMIPKKTASASVSKLHIIVLFNALFNLLNKRVGRDMLSQAELFRLIPKEAYGSRKNRRAVECALNKVLSMNIIRQYRRTAALCSTDAKSCYDRILHSIASMAMQRMGVSPSTCHMMLGTLQDVRHYIRTSYGDSASSYGSISIPLQGVLQGNGAGPAIWLVVSIPIINMIKAEGFGLKCCTPITKEEFHFVCYTFVDDTDLIHCPKGT